MIQTDAEQIAGWHYDGIYSFYDASSDAEDLAELLNPELRGDQYFSVYQNNRLAGYFTYNWNDERQSIVIGLGMHPDLTGKGLGGPFLEAGLEYGQKLFMPARRFELSVAAFNKRAMKVYRKAGFSIRKRSFVRTNGGRYEFVHMDKQVKTSVEPEL